MRCRHKSLGIGPLLILLLSASGAAGQHSDVLLQSDGAKIAVGSANFTGFSWTIGTRVFARDFDSDYLIDNPGWDVLSNSSPFLPPGYFALPPSSPVGWDFLPMTVGNTVANLMYWNGQDLNANGVDSQEVAFVTLPGANISLEGAGGTTVADGSSQLVTGPTLVNTDSSGAVHSHRNYRLDDGDMNAGTNPVDGIYLLALHVRMAALETSDPFYLVFGPPSSTFLAARNAAVAWVTDRVDTLVVELPGDYNNDHVVDALDYTVWRNSFGLAISLPNEADTPNVVDNADFAVWKQHYGTTTVVGAGGGSSNALPEPSAATFAVAIAALLAAARRRCD